MKYGPLIAVIFGFFLIAIYPYYADDEPAVLIVSDDDGDRVPNDKDLCPEEDASGKDVDEDGCIDEEITKKEIELKLFYMKRMILILVNLLIRKVLRILVKKLTTKS